MTRRIVIEVQNGDNGNFDVSVDVSGELNTLEAIGLMEIAKEQHRSSKLMPGPTVYQTPDK
jgi:hypothetical protein